MTITRCVYDVHLLLFGLEKCRLLKRTNSGNNAVEKATKGNPILSTSDCTWKLSYLLKEISCAEYSQISQCTDTMTSAPSDDSDQPTDQSLRCPP